MADGLTINLLLVAICAWVLGVLFLGKLLPPWLVVIVALVKVAIPCIYFAWYDNGTWKLVDDVLYLHAGAVLLHEGYTPLTALTQAQGIARLITISGGTHILYQWWNLLSQYLFGEHYYAPVFMNVLLTYIGGYYLYKLALFCGFTRTYSRWLLLFFLLHWDVLAWSSIVNLKDIMVATLTTISLYYTLRFCKQPSFRAASAVLLLIFILIWIREYLPILMMFATVVWLALYRKGWGKYWILILSASLGAGVVARFGLAYLESNVNTADIPALVVGVFRMLLTPQPWSLEPNYTFLLIPSILHWLLFVPAVVGGFALWRRSKEFRLLLIYLAITLMLYGGADMFQGGRQRVQLTFIIAWMQFHFFWSLFGGVHRSRHTVENPNEVGKDEAACSTDSYDVPEEKEF